MKKVEFLGALGGKLAGLPQADIDKTLSYYSEMIDDRMEDGVPEEEAVAALGSVDEIAEQTIRETPIAKLVKERVKPKRKMRAIEIVLLILGAPLWIPLGITALVLIFVFFLILWLGTIILASLCLSFGASCLGLIVSTVAYFLAGSPAAAVCCIGGSLVCLGLTLLMVPATFYTAKGTAKLCKNIVLGIKSMLIGKGREQQ